MRVAADEATIRKEKAYMNKLNLILVQVCLVFVSLLR
jgi:hypothetical protein